MSRFCFNLFVLIFLVYYEPQSQFDSAMAPKKRPAAKSGGSKSQHKRQDTKNHGSGDEEKNDE